VLLVTHDLEEVLNASTWSICCRKTDGALNSYHVSIPDRGTFASRKHPDFNPLLDGLARYAGGTNSSEIEAKR
jgi:hypothetical protein